MKSSLRARSEDEVIGGGFWGWRCSRSASGLHHSSGRVMVGEVMMLGCRGGGRSVMVMGGCGLRVMSQCVCSVMLLGEKGLRRMSLRAAGPRSRSSSPRRARREGGQRTPRGLRDDGV